jgi:arylsulfatase A-like enzyme
MTSNAPTRPPNILWICTDQQRWDTLGCYDNPWVQTPHLDRLASDGLVFERCYRQSPVCTPSRASFLTGRYPRTNRCRQNGQALPPDEVLVTKLLADAGYVGGLAGKLHIAACHPSVSPGFEPRMDDGYAEFHWSHHPAPEWPTNEYFHWLRERGVTYTRTPFRDSPYVRTSVAAEHHQTTWCAQKAINFIEASAAFDRPWFFSVNFYDPHHPFDPPAGELERYLDRLDDIPLPNYVPSELDDKPIWQHQDNLAAYNTPGLYPFAEMAPEDHRLLRAAYWAMVDLIDAQVGRILEAVDRTGARDNTLVIFMSDHGEMLGDHGIYLKGPYFYEPAVRVPMLIALPRAIQGSRRSNALVELADLAPTLLEAAGLPFYEGMQGRSLWPLLKGDGSLDHHHDDVYCEYLDAMSWHRNPPANTTMLRTERYKLVALHGLDGGELYDLDSDPHETHNRWNDPAYRAIRSDLTAQLCDRIALAVDPLPPRVAQW